MIKCMVLSLPYESMTQKKKAIIIFLLTQHVCNEVYAYLSSLEKKLFSLLNNNARKVKWPCLLGFTHQPTRASKTVTFWGRKQTKTWSYSPKSDTETQLPLNIADHCFRSRTAPVVIPAFRRAMDDCTHQPCPTRSWRLPLPRRRHPPRRRKKPPATRSPTPPCRASASQ